MSDGDIKRLGRRALLTGAVAGVAATALEGVLGPREAQAGDPPVLMGAINQTPDPTRIYTPTFSNHDRFVILNGTNYGVAAQSDVDDGFGVRGYATGVNGIGVIGVTDGDATTVGVFGDSETYGIGVDGRSVNGAGVRATATGGYALDVHGRAVFSRSGKVTFAAGTSSKSVTRTGPANYLGPATIAVASIQGHVPGTWVAGVTIVTTKKLTIYLNQPAPKSLVVGWFLVN